MLFTDKPKNVVGIMKMEDFAIFDNQEEYFERYELNCCDRCGIIELSKDLFWLNYDEIKERVQKQMCEGNYVAICELCEEDLA